MPGSDPSASFGNDDPLPLADLDDDSDGPEGLGAGDAALTYASSAGPARPPAGYGAALSDEDSDAVNSEAGSPALAHGGERGVSEVGTRQGGRPYRLPPVAMTFADPEAPDAEPHRPTSNTPSPTGPRKAAGLMVCEVTDTATRSSRTIDILHRNVPPVVTNQNDDGENKDNSDEEEAEEEDEGTIAAANAPLTAATAHRGPSLPSVVDSTGGSADADSDSDHLDDPLPAQPPPSARQQLPSGWRSRVDQASGKVYYWNEVTGRTQWDRPEVRKLVVPTPAPAPAPAPSPVQPDAGSAPPLPAGWVRHEDPLTERPYYHNPATNQTVWRLPAVEGTAAPAPGKVVAQATPKPKSSAGKGMGKGNRDDFMDIAHQGFAKSGGPPAAGRPPEDARKHSG
eukprot:EG_transcript_15144